MTHTAMTPMGVNVLGRKSISLLNEEVGFKILTTRSLNNSVFCGVLLHGMHVGLPVWGGALGLLRWLGA